MSGLQENLKSMYAHDAIVLAGIENGSIRGILLTQGMITIVDAEDYKWLSQYKWCVHRQKYTFYAERGVCTGKKIYTLGMHRLILGLERGDKREIDHKDHNGLNNQKCNLRIVDHFLNGWNRKVHINNTSGYRGIYWSNRRNQWQACISIRGKKLHSKYYINPVDAAVMYDKLSLKYRGNDGKLNFPEREGYNANSNSLWR